MERIRDRKNYTPEHLSHRYRLSHPMEISVARRDIKWEDNDVGKEVHLPGMNVVFKIDCVGAIT